MFDYFHFSLPRAVTEQLVERLDQLKSTSLTDEALANLVRFQAESEAAQGVYVIYQGGSAVYAGKADSVAERLTEHLWKLRGRYGIDLAAIGFKALLLDGNWSTSANEDLLIQHFKIRKECRWNGSGFGPKDPGKNRDGGEPSWFDNNYPIREDYLVDGIDDNETAASLLKKIKSKIPYLLRYEVATEVGATTINLAGVPRTTQALTLKTAQVLGVDWQLMKFKNGFTLYKANKSYENGSQLYP